MFVDGLLKEIPKFNPEDLYAFSIVVARLFEIRWSNYTVPNELAYHNALVRDRWLCHVASRPPSHRNSLQCTSNYIVFLQEQKVTMAGWRWQWPLINATRSFVSRKINSYTSPWWFWAGHTQGYRGRMGPYNRLRLTVGNIYFTYFSNRRCNIV